MFVFFFEKIWDTCSICGGMCVMRLELIVLSSNPTSNCGKVTEAFSVGSSFAGFFFPWIILNEIGYDGS